MPPHPDAKETYRLIITRRNASEMLLSPNGKDWSLPRVEIRRHQRIAEQLTAEIRKAWDLETYCLFVPNTPATRQAAEEIRCALLECANGKQKAHSGTYWMPVDVASECSEREEAALIRDAFAELNSYRSGEKLGPFAKPGWLKDLFQWAYEQTAPLGLRLMGNFQQYNASPTFSLMRLETDGAALWFKATGEPNAHELAVTQLLARLFPKQLPRILGVHTSWNGWLSQQVQGAALDELTQCSAWERAAESLAELQIESIGRGGELVEGQCKDMRLSEAEKHIDSFFARMREFMRVQQKASPAPLTDAELESLGDGLKDAFALLESFKLPDTLGHLDCNPGNIIVSPESCIFLDWAEGCVTNPVVTFEYLRRHLERSEVKDPAADARITDAYLRPWTPLFSPDGLRRAVAAVPPVAVFIHAIAGNTWRDLDPVANPALASYFRALTRRMYRDAVLAAERSERCLS